MGSSNLPLGSQDLCWVCRPALSPDLDPWTWLGSQNQRRFTVAWLILPKSSALPHTPAMASFSKKATMLSSHDTNESSSD